MLKGYLIFIEEKNVRIFFVIYFLRYSKKFYCLYAKTKQRWARCSKNGIELSWEMLQMWILWEDDVEIFKISGIVEQEDNSTQ